MGPPTPSLSVVSVDRGFEGPCLCTFLDKSIPNSKKKGLVLLFELVVQKALWLCVVFGPRWPACMVCRAVVQTPGVSAALKGRACTLSTLVLNWAARGPFGQETSEDSETGKAADGQMTWVTAALKIT